MIELAGLLDRGVLLQLLIHELTAGEAENGQSLFAVGLVQLLQAVELRGKAAFGCCIDNEHDVAFIRLQRLGLAAYRFTSYS